MLQTFEIMIGWFYYLIAFILSNIILQIGLTKRRKIIEENKLKRINKLKELNDSKINAIGYYEKK